MRTQTDQHWGTPNPITIRDKEFGAIRLRGFGIYSYHLAAAKTFYSKIISTRDLYRVADLEGQLRNTIVAKMTDAFATSQPGPVPRHGRQARARSPMHHRQLNRHSPNTAFRWTPSTSKIFRYPTNSRKSSTSASA